MRLKIHWTELPGFAPVVDPRQEPLRLLFLADLKPVFDQDYSRMNECFFNRWAVFQEIRRLVFGVARLAADEFCSSCRRRHDADQPEIPLRIEPTLNEILKRIMYALRQLLIGNDAGRRLVVALPPRCADAARTALRNRLKSVTFVLHAIEVSRAELVATLDTLGVVERSSRAVEG